MKKILAVLLAVAIIVAAVFIVKALVGNGNGGDSQTPTTQETQGTEAPATQAPTQAPTEDGVGDEWSSSTDIEWHDPTDPPVTQAPTEPVATEETTQPATEDNGIKDDFGDEWSTSTDIVWH